MGDKTVKELKNIRQIMRKCIKGQDELIDGLILTMLSSGHALIEGVPGLAKTFSVKVLAQLVDAHFQRIQFTPDLLPSDVIGTEMFIPGKTDLEIRQGPIFTQILLADEINRAPAKVQSSLLEAMEERQVSIGRETYNLGEGFWVFATQNPVEQTGTYPLPEAQLDRFLCKLLVDYPKLGNRTTIIDRPTKDA